ncbi:RNA polymerase sigma-70 factor [Carboxylicivirga sp. A043]|uniref:RNA polymerase sigma-70 factor n=1 Tax=Carboxylicivirga litoralis TaxID=2816963 RepID=UPI0021CB3284|nr:RNA polymerase sigma-70 factor [Carboxylicivirga sp. A043]MCU4155546.1 RNA polymerase sigma-70 factor [Carboxylicivirga sp. A043]
MKENIKDITFDDIFNLYYPRCVLFATKLLGNRWDAEEAVQELFISLWSKGKLKSIDGSVKSYLFKAVFNSCIDVQRKNKIKQRSEVDSPEGQDAIIPFSNPILEEELEKHINDALMQLPEKRRQVFLMSRDEGLSYREIAQRLSVSEKTIETQISRSLKQLRTSLSEYLPGLLF